MKKMIEQFYDTLENYLIGMDRYEAEAIDVMAELFEKSDVNYKWDCTHWPDMSGGIATFSWIENGELFLEGFEYTYCN